MARTKPKAGRFSVTLPSSDHMRLARIADANHLTLNSVIVQAVRLFLEQAGTEEGYVLHLRDPGLKEMPDARPSP